MAYFHSGSSYLVVAMLAMVAFRMVGRGRRRAGGTGRPAGTARQPYGASVVEAPARTAADDRGHGIPAGWLVDPSGRFEQRYWSGSEWTEQVTKGGVTSLDPPPGSRTEGR